MTIVCQITAIMVYSLRRIGEPRAFTAVQGSLETENPEKLLHIVIGVEPVCELLSIYGKYFDEFELDLTWLFQTALNKLLSDEEYLESIIDLVDGTCSEVAEAHTLLTLVESASACISNSLPELTPKQLACIQYSGYKYGKIALAITPDL